MENGQPYLQKKYCLRKSLDYFKAFLFILPYFVDCITTLLSNFNMRQKNLGELSLEELWQLFPIILTAHQKCWAEWYQEERELLKQQLPYAERISHIGSTAVNGIWAKPIIDILVGYTLQGYAERVFHLHLRYEGDNDELYFRDYLQTNPTVAKEYERLKLDLWKLYEHDRDKYTMQKGDFIKQCTQKGKEIFGGRYDNKG